MSIYRKIVKDGYKWLPDKKNFDILHRSEYSLIEKYKKLHIECKKPKSIICENVHFAVSIVPSILQRHFDIHPNFLKNYINYFKKKANGVWKVRVDVWADCNNQNMVALIARAMKPHKLLMSYCGQKPNLWFSNAPVPVCIPPDR
ncbi:hypothetical protein RF11_11313 [Thelohanellus kitauei]|uniref:Uncharacterized protein n=1 Tax=Thelohanellus kitauei TaxID=669202 RepID=A0A0C2I7P3_THEKT|nr:hypothetical protein RF11_11313 [Thelohanellus kitauei]